MLACGLFKSLLNRWTVPSGSFGFTELIERLLSPCANDGDGDGAEEFGEIDLARARDAAVEASKPDQCIMGDFTVSEWSGFGDFTRWDGRRDTEWLETWEFGRPVAAEGGRMDDMVEIHEWSTDIVRSWRLFTQWNPDFLEVAKMLQQSNDIQVAHFVHGHGRSIVYSQ